MTTLKHPKIQWVISVQTSSEIDPMLSYSFRKPHILNKVISCWQKSIVLLFCLHHDGRQTWPDQVWKQSLLLHFIFSDGQQSSPAPESSFQKKSHLTWGHRFLVLCLRTSISQPRPVFMGKIWSPANCLVNTMLIITAAPFVFRKRARFVYHT